MTFAIAVSIALLCAGSVPFTVHDSSGFMGQVTDGNTGAPISNSHLTITLLMRPDLMTTHFRHGWVLHSPRGYTSYLASPSALEPSIPGCSHRSNS
jgi:hypothetical protein